MFLKPTAQEVKMGEVVTIMKKIEMLSKGVDEETVDDQTKKKLVDLKAQCSAIFGFEHELEVIGFYVLYMTDKEKFVEVLKAEIPN